MTDRTCVCCRETKPADEFRRTNAGNWRSKCKRCSGNQIDVDEMAVHRAVAGDRDVHLNRRELHVAIAQLLPRGLSQRAIAERIGCCERTVNRHNVRIRREAS